MCFKFPIRKYCKKNSSNYLRRQSVVSYNCVSYYSSIDGRCGDGSRSFNLGECSWYLGEHLWFTCLPSSWGSNSFSTTSLPQPQLMPYSDLLPFRRLSSGESLSNDPLATLNSVSDQPSRRERSADRIRSAAMFRGRNRDHGATLAPRVPHAQDPACGRGGGRQGAHVNLR